MTNTAHRAIFDQGASIWNAWKSRQTLHPDLSGSNFEGIDLSGYDFSRTNLSGVDFRGIEPFNPQGVTFYKARG